MNHPSALDLITRTPIWVWFILAALIALGLVQSRDRVMHRNRLIAVPLVLLGMSLIGALSAFGVRALVELTWLGGLLAGITLQLGLKPALRARALGEQRFAIAGSWQPMVLMLGVFMLRYAVAVTLAITPQLANVTAFTAGACGLYGLMAGLFAGRTLRVLLLAPGECSGASAQPA